MVTLTWRGTATATSSIAHGGETRGTITLLRRELVLTPEGIPTYIPIISGNSFRGLLRRTGEELLRETLHYEGTLPLAVAHALRAGGSLAKTGKEPLSGRRLETLRTLVPQVGVFGCAGGGRIIDGCLQVGKVIPHLVETRHLLHPPPPDPARLLTAFEATQLETYIRHDDASTHAFTGLVRSPVDPATGDLTTAAVPAESGPEERSVDEESRSLLMMYRVETFPAGTRFATWLRLSHATDLEAAFFTDVLATFATRARLGGRAAIGHGTVALDLTLEPTTPSGSHLGATTAADAGTDAMSARGRVGDWRSHLVEHREEALAALQALA